MLDADDILVVFTDAITFKSESSRLTLFLERLNITSHQAGLTSSRDVFKVDDSVTLSGIYRAKGNEAPMVYVVNADECADGYNLERKRNILFTAITRSRAWVRVCGVGERMAMLQTEIEKLKSSDYELCFNQPTAPQLASMRRIHRDRSAQEQEAIRKAKASLEQLMQQLEDGSLDISDIPLSVREKFSDYFSGQDE